MRKRRTRLHIFITNLAIADMTVALLWSLGNAVQRSTIDLMSQALCDILAYTRTFSINLGVYSAVFMAVDRYVVICRPHSSLAIAKRRHIYQFIAGAWVIALVTALPDPWTYSLLTLDLSDSSGNSSSNMDGGIADLLKGNESFAQPQLFRLCLQEFYPPKRLRYWAAWVFCSQYLIPIVICIVSYIKIWRRISQFQRFFKTSSCDGAATTGGSASTSNHQFYVNAEIRRRFREGVTRVKLRTAKLILVVVIVYIICWLPYVLSFLRIAILLESGE